VTTFVAIYRGDSISTARLLAVSSDHLLVARFIAELVNEDEIEAERDERETLTVLRGDDK
jgi:hypothetical protein